MGEVIGVQVPGVGSSFDDLAILPTFPFWVVLIANGRAIRVLCFVLQLRFKDLGFMIRVSKI